MQQRLNTQLKEWLHK